MSLNLHLSKKAERVYRFVKHDLIVAEQLGQFYRPKEITMRFLNESGDMMVGGFRVEWERGWLTFTPLFDNSCVPLVRKLKGGRRRKELDLGSFLIPKYKTYLFGLVKIQTAYNHKTEI